MKKAVFIINPKAGTGSGKFIQKHIEGLIQTHAFDARIVITEYAGHASKLALEAVKLGEEQIIAVGGDGTVREVALSLVNQAACLGIIPVGSGNGLARHLRIPIDSLTALKVLESGRIKTIDTLLVNEHFSINISGIGFDAYVARLFAVHGKRGFLTYAKIALSELLKYKPVECKIITGEKSFTTKAFIVIFANGSQWGNNAIIAPSAKEDDGLVTVGILNKPSLFQMAGFAYRLFTGRLQNSVFLNYLACDSIELTTSTPADLHIDGDPAGLTNTVHVRVLPSSLNILIP